MHRVFMTINACALRDASVSRFDFDRLVIILKREGQRMEKTIVGFGYPLPHKIMWKVTVVANRHMVMAAILPGIHVLLHDVTVDTRFRIVAQIARAFAIPKREGPDTSKQA